MDKPTPQNLNNMQNNKISYPSEVDLISEAGGNEFFLIEGDSLILDLVKAPHRSIDWSYSGQFLQLLAAIETFLHQFVMAGGKFAIIFFDIHQDLWDASMQCFRSLLIQHLVHKTDITVHCLPTWESQEEPRFEREFLLSLPAFIALTDGQHADKNAQTRFEAFYRFCGNHIHCSYISSIRLRSSRLIGLINRPKRQAPNRGKKQQRKDNATQQPAVPRVEWCPPTDLSWRECVVTEACRTTLRDSQEDDRQRVFELIKVMLLHTNLLDHVTLEMRALNVTIESDRTTVNQFLKRYFEQLMAILDRYDFGCHSEVDLFDGRLFHSLLVYFSTSQPDAQTDLKELLGTDTAERVGYLWTMIAGPGSPVIPRIDFVHGQCAPSALIEGDPRMITCASAVKSIVLTEELGTEGRDFAPPQDVVEFSEINHWHSGKPLQDSLWTLSKGNDDSAKDIKLQRWENKHQQLFYRHMARYAASLEGNKLYRNNNVILGSKINEVKQPKKAKTTTVSKSQTIIQKNMEEKAKKARLEWLNYTKKSINVLIRDGNRTEAMKRLEKQLQNANPNDVNFDIRLTMLNIHLYDLEELRKTNKESEWKIQSVKVEVFKLVHKIIDKHGQASKSNAESLLTDNSRKELVSALLTLGFKDSAKLTAKELGIKVPPSTSKLNEDSIRFQLQCMGHLLKRKNSDGFDSRVGFNPDAWQKELIDIVDKNGSALVVAPTSAGKTFISYYSMKRILEATQDGIVVYISPTKALVNQVSADIYARFQNAQEQLKNGTSIFGYFTRDFRHKPLNCRILVCVPQCFEILLLSPMHAEWRKKIKYVIFDEVHSIAEVGSGEVWEHLFSLIQCPFLALSATIQDTEKLRDWLQIKLDQQRLVVDVNGNNVNIQPPQETNQKVHLIEYKHRYSDLTRYVYNPKTYLTRIHPCSLVSAFSVLRNGFPKEIMLEPCDLLMLVDAMTAIISKLPDATQTQVKELSCGSNVDFTSTRQVTKRQVNAWQEKITSTIVNLAEEGHIEWLDKVFSSLGKITETAGIEDIFPLLVRLKEQKELPAIVFSFDRNICETLALQTALKVENKALAERKPAPKVVQLKIKETRGSTSRNLDPETLRQIERPMDLSRLIEAQFSFVDPTAETDVGIDDSWLTYVEKKLLSLGIGVHHAGKGTKYRQMVEFLFRTKAIQVVFATSTLALGVNMPCKTVIFAKDSMYLNSLSFRQMSGRAGRRGFDKKGNVIFLGVSTGKMQRLFNGDLPILETKFPLSVTLVLRAFLLYKDEPTAASALKIKKLFSAPLSTHLNDQHLRKFFRFAMEYLMEENLLDQSGKTIGLAGLAAHLWWSEPANLLLVSLIQRSVLHRICKDENLTAEQKKKTLLIVLSTLFNPKEIHQSMNDHIKGNTTASKIVLETPPQYVVDAITAHNNSVIRTFLNTRRSIERLRKADATLPLSKKKYRVHDAIPVGDLHQHLSLTRVITSLTEPFSALSGRTDHFTSVREICTCMSDIDEGMLPVFQYRPGIRLNRYVLDFYEHEQLVLLESANKLRSGESYEYTNQFRLLLKAISTALVELTDENDLLRKFMVELANEYGTRLKPEIKKRVFISRK